MANSSIVTAINPRVENMRKSVFLYLFASLTLFSCKEEDDIAPEVKIGDLKVSVSNEFGQLQSMGSMQ